MRVTTEQELRDDAATVLGSSEPVVITRDGKMAGIYLPSAEGAVSPDLRRSLFSQLSSETKKLLIEQGANPAEVLEDFDLWRNQRLATHR